MKKICFITTVSMTLKAFVVETAKYLHDIGGYDISFICNPDSEFLKDLPEYIHYYPVAMKRGINIEGIRAIYKIKRIFSKEKFDLIQYSTPNAACYAAIAGALEHIPVRLYCQWGIAYVGFSGIKRRIFKFIEKTVCSLSTWIEPDSFGNLQFSHSEGLYPINKGSVIWNGSASGVNLNKFNIQKKLEWRRLIRQHLNIPVTSMVFIFVGRVTKDKGINELFCASQKLMEKYNNIFLLLVGPDENGGNVDGTLYQWSRTCEKVIYCGFTNEVEKYLAASDVYVLPSYREGFGSAVVEAEAMGVPVIVSDIPGPTDAMKDNETGLIVEKANSDSLKRAMELFYNDIDLRNQYGDNAHEFAVQYFAQTTLFEKILKDRERLIAEEYR